MLIGVGLVVALACGSTTAQDKDKDKFDAKKLVGKWEPKETKKDETMVMEFTKDGKITITGTAGGKALEAKGTYKLEGDKLMFEITFMGETIKETVTLSKLTDEEMEGKGKDGKSETFKKVKPKDKK
jgi:uncharacterized protein (TIGR03066 family)